jgi:hypothetical protein
MPSRSWPRASPRGETLCPPPPNGSSTASSWTRTTPACGAWRRSSGYPQTLQHELYAATREGMLRERTEVVDTRTVETLRLVLEDLQMSAGSWRERSTQSPAVPESWREMLA